MIRRPLMFALALGLVMAGCDDDSEGADTVAADTTADTAADAAADTVANPDTGARDTPSTDEGEADTTVDAAPDMVATDSIGLVSFSVLYNGVLTAQGCTSGYCHGSGAGGMDFSTESAAYAALVDVDATSPVCNLVKRVVPGKPEQSILWVKSRNPERDPPGALCADKMPQGSSGLSEDDAQVLESWIAGGATP